MNKHFYIILLTFFTVPLQAQVTVDNFESGNKGWDAVTWMGYTDVRRNDYKSGINLSDYVMFTQRAAGDNNWAGAILKPYQTNGYKYLHAYMYRSNSGVPNLKVSDTNAQDLVPMNRIVANEWQDVVFDISDYETSGIEFIFFMVDRADVTELAWMLIDEICLSNDPTPRTAVVGSDPVTPPATDDYQLVWSDEFNGTALDTDIWNIEVNGDGGGNNELQYYCEKAVRLENGCLVLTATKEDYMGKKCTSGRVNTLGKVYYTYGKIEARIKFPNTANGLWPAFWQMGNNFSEVGWPKCGETDIIELGHVNGINSGTQDRYFNGAMHVGSAWNTVWSDAQSITYNYSVEDDFHLISMIWTPTSIDMYVDKDIYPNAAPYFHADLKSDPDPDYDRSIVFGKPNFIIFNLAVGGNFPSIYDINGITALADGPRSMYVDYVRVYQKGEAGETLVGKNANQPSAVENVENTEINRIEYYDLQGRLLRAQPQGISIRRTIYKNGTIKTEKLLK